MLILSTSKRSCVDGLIHAVRSHSGMHNLNIQLNA